MTPTKRRVLVLLPAAALLAAALIPVAAAQEKGQPGPPASPRMERQRPLAELNLTPDQIKALEAFREARREKARAFREDIAKLREEMRALRADPEANKGKIEALIDRRASLMAGHEKEAFRARAERNAIFTPEQLEKLKTMRSRPAARGARGGAWMGRAFDGRFAGRRAGLRPMLRRQALRHRMALRRWRW